MKNRLRKHLPALAPLAIVTALACPSAHAQSFWMPRDRDRCVEIEFLEPGLELIKEDFPTAAVFVSGRLPAGSGLSVVAEIPFARFSGDYDLFIGTSHASQSAFGNPYVGVELHQGDSPIFGEFGVRLPAFNEDNFHAAIPGGYSDVTRFDAYLDDYVPIHMALNLREVSAKGIAARLRFGPMLLVPDGGTNGLDTEIFGVYAWQIGYEGRVVRFGSAIAGRILLTDDSGNLGGRSTNQFELHADFGASTLRPGVDFKLPLGSAAFLVPSVLGASLGIAF